MVAWTPSATKKLVNKKYLDGIQIAWPCCVDKRMPVIEEWQRQMAEGEMIEEGSMCVSCPQADGDMCSWRRCVEKPERMLDGES